jgi:hypothetical protein
MTFELRALMVKALPEAEGHELHPCGLAMQGRRKTPPTPKPPTPQCVPDTTSPPAVRTECSAPAGAGLPSLAKMREQLRQALHA